jgi:hypothetical protein
MPLNRPQQAAYLPLKHDDTRDIDHVIEAVKSRGLYSPPRGN